MIEASTQFMVGSLSTESGKCNRFNLDGIFGNDRCGSSKTSADLIRGTHGPERSELWFACGAGTGRATRHLPNARGQPELAGSFSEELKYGIRNRSRRR